MAKQRTELDDKDMDGLDRHLLVQMNEACERFDVPHAVYIVFIMRIYAALDPRGLDVMQGLIDILNDEEVQSEIERHTSAPPTPGQLGTIGRGLPALRR